MRWVRGGRLVQVLAVVALASVAHAATDEDATADAAAPEQASTVYVEGDRVTATFEGTTPDAIVREVASGLGAEIVGGVQGADPVTIDIEDVPVDRLLERVLGGQSFTIVYGLDGSVRRIRLHGAAQAAPPSGATTTKQSTAAGNRILPHQLFDVEVRIPSVGPLAEHVGADTATLGQLYRIAVDQDEAALRIAAVDASMAAIESDPSLQTSVDSLLDTTDDAVLSGLVRGSAGKRANELVSRILSRTRRPQVRQRAVSILRQLRQPTS